MLSNTGYPFPDSLPQIRAQAWSLFHFFNDGVEGLGQLTVLSFNLFDHMFEARLPLSHLVHVTVLLLESEVLGDVRLRGAKASAQPVWGLSRCRINGFAQHSQIVQQSVVSPAQGFCYRCFCSCH